MASRTKEWKQNRHKVEVWFKPSDYKALTDDAIAEFASTEGRPQRAKLLKLAYQNHRTDNRNWSAHLRSELIGLANQYFEGSVSRLLEEAIGLVKNQHQQ